MDLGADERAELAALRSRVANLQDTQGAGRSVPGGRRHRLRSFCSALLIVLGCVLVPPAALAVWTSATIGDTDRYLATVAPLAANPDVRAAVTNRVTDAVVEHLDIGTLLQQVAPGDRPRLEFALGALSGPLTSGLKDLVRDVVQRFVASDAFETVWTEVNRTSHATMNKALTGSGGGAVQLTGGTVTIDMAPVVEQVKQRLVDRGLTVAGSIPAVHTDFTVLESDDIGRARTGFRVLQIMGGWLPLAAVLPAAAGVLLAGRRRRALIGAALGFAAAAVVLGIGLTVFRAVYLDALPSSVSPAAARAVYEALIRFLRSTVRMVLVLGVVVALGSWICGPGRWAVRARSMWTSGIGAARDVTGLRTGPVGDGVHRLKTWLNWGVVAAAAVALLLWNRPTGMVVWWLALAVVGVLAVIEFLDDRNDRNDRNGSKDQDDAVPPVPASG
ncbi:hypothetical protein QMK19_00620 [Streptomyces sp. H10-C2]|uniref:hypothetical protein n=1 Tax=unclassified Streptomyces TaxID=2593676 RepID=UPI0024B95BC3|nr:MULTISPECIES: hypothetical protein [unclassified Streptomyces]MDJ0340327.1 hypothetical protein [Streptomyces sp. PH10-H1]MDJ0368225.1 hypothetical protein [Streptomyces sp. H10-C2]